jgi:co-chaperonin GroES (HSP10)
VSQHYQSQQQQQRKSKGLVIAISGAANNGSGLIRITSSANPFQTGDKVHIKNVAGTVEANGKSDITRITGTTFDLAGSAFTNAYVSGGTVKRIQN